MPSFNLVVESPVSRSARARQLEAIFDVPGSTTSRVELHGEMPIEQNDWHIGLIVGPSGCGKSTILRELFGTSPALDWNAASVIDDFAATLPVQQISEACQAVGFNTIPAWLRPYRVLSNGEKFRVELARRLIETDGDIVMDEFTSVVDRQVAQIGSHAVQKYVRRSGKRFVAASCHYDIADWLQPDWIFEPASSEFQWRELRRRPELACEIARVPYSVWKIFAPFHYMTADLNRAARCFALAVEGRLAAFAAMLYRPHPKVRDIWGCSRLVTLPDYQGLGLAFALIDRLGAAYRTCGLRVHTYPAHPALIRGFDKSPCWSLHKKPGTFSPRAGDSSTARMGGRPCAVFEYAGPAMEDSQAARDLLRG